MQSCIAQRELLYSPKGQTDLRPFAIRIYAPLPASDDSAQLDAEAAGCRWEIIGLPEPITDTAFGADSLQALQLALNLDGVLRSLCDKYDLYFPSGEPYFGH